MPEHTPERAERSGALEAKQRVVRTASRGTIVSYGENKLNVSAEMERSGMTPSPYVRSPMSVKSEPLVFDGSVLREAYKKLHLRFRVCSLSTISRVIS